jgi:hypothetical protein
VIIEIEVERDLRARCLKSSDFVTELTEKGRKGGRIVTCSAVGFDSKHMARSIELYFQASARLDLRDSFVNSVFQTPLPLPGLRSAGSPKPIHATISRRTLRKDSLC